MWPFSVFSHSIRLRAQFNFYTIPVKMIRYSVQLVRGTLPRDVAEGHAHALDTMPLLRVLGVGAVQMGGQCDDGLLPRATGSEVSQTGCFRANQCGATGQIEVRLLRAVGRNSGSAHRVMESGAGDGGDFLGGAAPVRPVQAADLEFDSNLRESSFCIENPI